MRRDVLLGALALLALIGVSLLGRHEQTPKRPTRGSADFNSGGYRAWYDLMAREGVRVMRYRQHHDALPNSGIDTLVLAFPEDGFAAWDAAERDAVRAWVRAGGRLIDIGLTPRTSHDDAKDEVAFLEEHRFDRGPLHGTWASLVAALPQRGTDRLVPAPHKKFQTLLGDRAGALAVRYRYGKGEVIGLADAAAFQNDALERGDAARLAYLAARPGTPNGIVAFDEAVRGDLVEKAWYQALNAPELVALGIAALAGLLWLLYGIVPLGPPVRLRAPREPTSEEFVDAVAALYQRARARDHARDALVADARRSLDRAPRTAANVALAKSVLYTATYSFADDAALIDVAKLARTAREETIRATSPDRRSGAFARGVGARRRRR
ncbi:MAG: DUF4350 domain-containing protein [Candidatus Eremiobacteraeota bacterium]|nr:DUF4350 domain-containing protein [Candidatus Eremiobacteraeota bacterium]